MPNLLEVEILGEALNSYGLIGNNTISGIGLDTFGFIWNTHDIWIPCDPTITTTWANANPSISTTWSNAEPSVTTTWTEV